MDAIQIQGAFSSLFRLIEINSELLMQMANIDERTASGEIGRCDRPN
jgi:hypothetical protein